MKKGELVQRYNELVSVTNLQGIKLLYAVKRNKDILKPITEQLHHTVLIPASDEYIAYEESFNMLDPKAEDYHKQVQQLRETNKEVINQRNIQIKEYNATMLEEYEGEVPVFYIPLSIAPITQEQFNPISFMVADMTGEQEMRFNELFDSLL